MAKGDYDAYELRNMGRAAMLEGADPYVVATDALRVLPQLTAADLQLCLAFRLDPFSYLAATLAETDAVAEERRERIDRVDREAKYQGDLERWGRAEIERHRSL